MPQISLTMKTQPCDFSFYNYFCSKRKWDIIFTPVNLGRPTFETFIFCHLVSLCRHSVNLSDTFEQKWPLLNLPQSLFSTTSDLSSMTPAHPLTLLPDQTLAELIKVTVLLPDAKTRSNQVKSRRENLERIKQLKATMEMKCRGEKADRSISGRAEDRWDWSDAAQRCFALLLLTKKNIYTSQSGKEEKQILGKFIFANSSHLQSFACWVAELCKF